MERTIFYSIFSLVALVDPRVRRLRPIVQLGSGKPQANLVVGRVDRVRAVADVAPDLDREVAANGAGGGIGRVGGAKHDAARLDDALALPDHCHNWPRVHVVDKSGKERTSGKIGIVLLEVRLARLDHFDSDQLEALLLESLDDLAD